MFWTDICSQHWSNAVIHRIQLWKLGGRSFDVIKWVKWTPISAEWFLPHGMAPNPYGMSITEVLTPFSKNTYGVLLLAQITTHAVTKCEFRRRSITEGGPTEHIVLTWSFKLCTCSKPKSFFIRENSVFHAGPAVRRWSWRHIWSIC